MPGNAGGVTAHIVMGSVSTGSLAALLPGVDGWVLAFAISGGLIFVLNAKETSLFKRIIYFPISVLLGYTVAIEGLPGIGDFTQNILAFLGSALSISLIIHIMELLTSGKLFKLLSDWLGRRG